MVTAILDRIGTSTLAVAVLEATLVIVTCNNYIVGVRLAKQNERLIIVCDHFQSFF